MRSRRLSTSFCLVTSTFLLMATRAQAQVDWSDLFPDEGGKPGAQARPPQPAPAPAKLAVRAAGRAQPHAPQAVRSVPQPVRVARPKPPPSRKVVTRPVAQDDDREFPAAADIAPAHFDRHSKQHASPATDVTESVPANDAPVAPAAAAPKVAAAPADTIERSAIHENVQTAKVAREPEVAPEAPAAVKRAAKAVAPAPVAEPPAAVPEAASAEEPIQVAAAMVGIGRRNGARPASGADIDNDSGVNPGDVINASNVDKYAHLLSPGLEWAVHYGLRIKVGAPRHIELPRAYREATEKYAGQVKLGPDGLRLVNYTAGQPFPVLDPNDPQIAVKIMWNYGYGASITDDLNAENFDADTGTIGKNRGMTVERHYMIDNLRRLNYNGRLYVDPKPEMPNPDGIRFKESLHPLSEPFDLKGVGATFYRFIDPDRQDDSWLYLPQLRRVRRLSTAQRSDALFGQDSDVDSYYGYNGHIAWMDWKFLGERTVLAAMHAEHAPVKWQEPEDWIFDDTWEPRKVFVIEGTSKVAQYAYGKRILFIDKEAWTVTHSDIYDRAGQLWKVWINLHAHKKEAIPGAKVSRYPDEMSFTHAIVMLDTQLVHATKAALPSTHSPGEECTFLNMGAKSGTTVEFFSVASLIEAGH
jgi:Protein of unknown function (DUF1329)